MGRIQSIKLGSRGILTDLEYFTTVVSRIHVERDGVSLVFEALEVALDDKSIEVELGELEIYP